MGKDYDVIIVGARVAGSSLAILLGRLGKRVLLVDRDSFPSHTLSTHQIAGFDFLQRLGVLDDILASGVRLLPRIRVQVDDCVVEGARETCAIAPARYLLDQTLISHALKHPTVEFRERVSVVGLLKDDGRVTGVSLRYSNGTTEELHAEVVVGADGKYSKIAEWVAAEQYDEVPSLRAGYYGYFDGVEPLLEPATELLFQDGRIGFVFPMEPTRDCLAMEIPVEEYETFRSDPEAEFERRFREFYGMERRLRHARLNGKVFGTRGISNYLRKPYGAGWALTGDAAYCKDPVSGLGINDAFLQSFLLADALEAVWSGEDWDTAMAQYQQQRDQRVLPAYRITHQLAEFQQPSKNDTALLKMLFANAAISVQWISALPSLLLQGTLLSPEFTALAKMRANHLYGYQPDE